MKRLLKISPLIIVASYGFFLNSKYYTYYFKDSGYPGLMPILMALFFILSEVVLWSYSSNKNKVALFLKYGLVLFSIFATLSSQYNSTSTKILDNKKVVYEKIDNTKIIESYLEQIKIQDKRIDQIFRQRENDFIFTLTDDSLKYAQDEKLKYQKKIEDLQTENKKDIQEVFTDKSIYKWFAIDLPRISKGGLNEEFIRVLFQLFSSLILAFIAPVCITLARNIYNIEIIKLLPVKKKTVKKTVKKLNLDKGNIDDIITILLYVKGNMLTAKECAEKFTGVYDRTENVKYKKYTEDKCKIVRDEIIRQGLTEVTYNFAIDKIDREELV